MTQIQLLSSTPPVLLLSTSHCIHLFHYTDSRVWFLEWIKLISIYYSPLQENHLPRKWFICWSSLRTRRSHAEKNSASVLPSISGWVISCSPCHQPLTTRIIIHSGDSVAYKVVFSASAYAITSSLPSKSHSANSQLKCLFNEPLWSLLSYQLL